MKKLVIYYSRTFTTQKLAQMLSDKLGADIYQIIDTKDRSGAKGWLMAGKDATFRALTQIESIDIDFSAYDLVIIGTPIWAFNMTPAIRTFLTDYKDKLGDVAFFATQDGSGSDRAFQEMSQILSKQPKSILVGLTKEVRGGNMDDKINEFINKLN